MEMMVAVSLVVLLAGVGVSILLISIRSVSINSVISNLNKGLSLSLDTVVEGVKFREALEMATDVEVYNRSQCVTMSSTNVSVDGGKVFKVKDSFGETIYSLDGGNVSSSSGVVKVVSDPGIIVSDLRFDWSCGVSRPDILFITMSACYACNTDSEVTKTLTREVTMYNSFR